MSKETRENAIAAKAMRKSTLASLKMKKRARLIQLKDNYEKDCRNINIQYSKDPERLKAKYAAAEYAKNEKAKKRAEKKIQREQRLIDLENSKRQFSIAEEISCSIVQGIGFGLSIAIIAIFDTLAVKNVVEYRTLTIVSYTLYGAMMTLMYLFSLLHHAIRNFAAKEVFTRLSHVCTFLIIGFGYTAYTVMKIQGVLGWVLFGIVWAVAIVGSVMYAIFGSRFSKLNIIFYIVTGWSGLFAVKTLYRVLSPLSFKMLVYAGLLYIVALVFYALRKIKFMSFVGNCLMLVGSAFMFFSLFYINV